MVGDDAARAAIERLLAVTGASFEQQARLEGALRSRIVIEQAKGVLAAPLTRLVRLGLLPLHDTRSSSVGAAREPGHRGGRPLPQLRGSVASAMWTTEPSSFLITS